MIIVQVTFTVKISQIQNFIQQTKINVENALLEPGITRFEFYRDLEISNVFMIFEIYNTKSDQLQHRETSHYQIWKKHVTDMLEKPYAIIQYELV